MKTISSGFAFALALAAMLGCSKKDDKAGEGGGGAAAANRCETAINAAIDSMIAKGNAGTGGPSPMTEIANKLRAIMTERCKADQWSESSLACFRAATDQPSIKACRQGLPVEQSQRLQQEIMKVMTGGGAGGMVPVARPAAPEGRPVRRAPAAGSAAPTGSGN